MKSNEKSARKSHVLRFWLVMLFCTAMIGTACLFAYTQTRQELSVQLDTTVSSIQPATNPPYTKPVKIPMTTPVRTEIVTERRTQPRVLETMPVAAPIAEPDTETVTQTVTEAKPRFCKPVEGDVLQPFSGGALVKSATTGVWQTHNGVDLAAALGDPVKAAAGGVVTQVSEDALWGITVTIDHKNGYLTRYCNLGTDLSVSEGDSVEAGFIIGAVGKTADAESVGETHLHFEVLKDGKYLDPEYLAAQ
ncbi:MAG: M23 family metallopeptidase [Oscillospiraceae bacterium]|nr:M23 family metallopeptidase [Oscillospiraceae bacterium]